MTADLHPRVQTVVDVLNAHGATGEVRILPDSARTAVTAAEALGIEPGAIANSLIFDAAGHPLLVLTSGAHRVDVEKLRAEHDLPELTRASPEFVRTHAGQAIGGVSPVGHPAPVRTFIDPWLAAYPQVWAAAGHPHAVFQTTYDELIKLTGATIADVA